jgi:hypothetical protein
MVEFVFFGKKRACWKCYILESFGKVPEGFTDETGRFSKEYKTLHPGRYPEGPTRVSGS